MKSGWYRLAMAGAMIVVGFNAWLALRAVHALFDAQNWRAHTLEVLLHGKTADDEVTKATADTRAYLLTGDAVYRARFEDAGQAAIQELDDVRVLTQDNGGQQQRIAYTRQRILVRLSALRTGMAMRDAAGRAMDASMLMEVLVDSPDHGPTVSYCLQQIQDEESRLLEERTRAATRARSIVLWTFIGASVLALLLIGVSAELLVRALADRQTLSDNELVMRGLNEELRLVNVSLEDRVAQRTRELANTNEELEAFSYSVSHDLRAPLRTIDGFSLALEEDYADKLDEAGRDYIRRVRAGVQRMGLLIDALLQLSRVTRAELQYENVDLSQLAAQVFADIRTQDASRPVDFVAQPGIVAVADSRLLRVAFENLIGNAWKFTSRTANPRIEFGSAPGDGEHEGMTVYFIRDNGAGFDMQYVQRLFTAFQRLHGDRDFKGSGIGLATVSRIIRRHHGSIWAEGAIGQGATFTFTLGGASA